MPMLAHFEDLPDTGDRRHWVRRALRLGTASGEAQVTVHDLSLTGALLETSVPMLVGSTIEIALPYAGNVDAAIVWNSGEFYGCQFELPISPAALSAAMLQSSPANADEPAGEPDPAAELRTLSAEMERLALRMQRLLDKLGTAGR